MPNPLFTPKKVNKICNAEHQNHSVKKRDARDYGATQRLMADGVGRSPAPPQGGGLSYKSDGDDRRKFTKNTLKGTRILVHGRG